MALGDGIRRNIADVDPSEGALLRDAILALNDRFFPGNRSDSPAPGGVTWWFKQDEIHQATHVHGGPEFIPWHREIVNRMEEMIRQINPQLSLHYWDWKQDPRAIPNANLGGGTTGTLNLFTADFMGYGGSSSQPIGPPWQEAAAPWRVDGFYLPGASSDRDSSGNPADPPSTVTRFVSGSPITAQTENDILNTVDFADMRPLLEAAHNAMHGFVNMGGVHISFRDPFVFLLHSGQDRIYARWQTDPSRPERLSGDTVYGRESGDPALNGNVEPWSTGHSIDTFGQEHFTRPWYAPENQGVPHTYKHPSIVFPPCYDTNLSGVPLIQVMNAGSPPTINFNDVPEGETAARAVVFFVYSCGDIHLSITPPGPTVVSGPPGTSFGVLLGNSVTVHKVLSLAPPEARFWISYKGTHAGDMATGTFTVHCDETNQDFVINITANTIARLTVATMLVLDQSGSMDWLAGIDATTKRIDILHQAATQFVQLAQDSSRVGDGVGMVSFDNNAYPGIGVTRNMGTGFDLASVITAIQNLHPQGATSIGNGLSLGRSTLTPVTGYDQQALVVFTDGLENTPLYIADVMGSINDRTFAIGLGTAQQVSVGALNALTNNTGGSLLLSGQLSPAIDDYFRLSKYFMQVLAGVKNNAIVTDPSGYISPGMKVRIPFVLNETDIDATVILLTDLRAIRFLIETPAGDIMSPAQAAGLGATYAVGANMIYYRFTLPLPLGVHPAQAGKWYALLELDEKVLSRFAQAGARFASGAGAVVHGVRYNVSVQSFSNLRMRAGLSQDSLQPGARLTVRAALTEYGIAVDHRATVVANVARPDGSVAAIAMPEVEPGIFEASTNASMQGVYRFDVVASGATMRGLPFTREQQLSGGVVLGGDNPPPTSGPSTRGNIEQFCQLLECLLGPGVLGRFLAERNIDPNAVRSCVERWCKQRLAGPSQQELEQREGVSATPAPAGGLGQLQASDLAGLLADILSGAQPVPGAPKAGPPAPPRKHKA